MIKNKHIAVEELSKWLKVSSIQYLGPVRFKKLYETLGEKFDKILDMSEKELLELKGIVTPQVIEGINKFKLQKIDYNKIAAAQIEAAKNIGGKIILLNDMMYPRFLYHSSMCHPVLYYIGKIENFTDFNKSIAVVGSRNASKTSLNFAKGIAYNFAKEGWVIVSGLAKGIDSAAHSGALEANGKTIAVLGGGPDIVYPPESKKLFASIAKNGLLISEYSFGTRPQALNLKKRNKTTVALSLGVIVVQTKSDGGTMNAFIASKEQKKKVFALEGKGEKFTGNNKIIEEGGIPINIKNAAEIIKENLLLQVI